MIVLGCIAEKLAGPNSVALLTDTILEYLVRNAHCLYVFTYYVHCRAKYYT